jgi:hypothetical protein
MGRHKKESQEHSTYPTVSVNEPKKRGWFKFFDKWKTKRRPTKTILITMRFNNGTEKDYVITHSGVDFEFDKGVYVVIPECGLHNLTHDMEHYIYDYGFPVPANRQIEVVAEDDAERKLLVVRPKFLKPFIKYEFARNLARSTDDIMKPIRAMLMMVIFTIVLQLPLLYMVYQVMSKVVK